ncbi:hypothetical protein J3R03_007173 [Actinoplanes couchii]|nr:hypothetical protein [Actinoplanes couchii]
MSDVYLENYAESTAWDDSCDEEPPRVEDLQVRDPRPQIVLLSKSLV